MSQKDSPLKDYHITAVLRGGSEDAGRVFTEIVGEAEMMGKYVAGGFERRGEDAAFKFVIEDATLKHVSSLSFIVGNWSKETGNGYSWLVRVLPVEEESNNEE